jgi:hypothetical protein
MSNPNRYFETLPEIIHLAVMMFVRYPISLRQVEELLRKRGVDISQESVRAYLVAYGYEAKFGALGLTSGLPPACDIRRNDTRAVRSVSACRAVMGL